MPTPNSPLSSVSLEEEPFLRVSFGIPELGRALWLLIQTFHVTDEEIEAREGS